MSYQSVERAGEQGRELRRQLAEVGAETSTVVVVLEDGSTVTTVCR